MIHMVHKYLKKFKISNILTRALTKKWNNDINIITLHYTKYLKINGIKISTDYSICYILDITIL